MKRSVVFTFSFVVLCAMILSLVYVQGGPFHITMSKQCLT